MKSTKMAEDVTAKDDRKTFGNVLLVAKRVLGYNTQQGHFVCAKKARVFHMFFHGCLTFWWIISSQINAE